MIDNFYSNLHGIDLMKYFALAFFVMFGAAHSAAADPCFHGSAYYCEEDDQLDDTIDAMLEFWGQQYDMIWNPVTGFEVDEQTYKGCVDSCADDFRTRVSICQIVGQTNTDEWSAQIQASCILSASNQLDQCLAGCS